MHTLIILLIIQYPSLRPSISKRAVEGHIRLFTLPLSTRIQIFSAFRFALSAHAANPQISPVTPPQYRESKGTDAVAGAVAGGTGSLPGMDLQMGDAVAGEPESDCLAPEVDFEYEFDAARFFDFSRAESPGEAFEAELWFASAGSYPPSPFIATIITGKDDAVENVNTLPKLKDEDNINPLMAQSDFEPGIEFSDLDKRYKGFGLHRDMLQDVKQGATKSTASGPFSRGSTLMKPTASQLAKQNRLRQAKKVDSIVNRYQNALAMKCEKSLEDQVENYCQAAKRQKLEGGHLCKLADTRQQKELVHKVPEKSSRLKLTIPREPELETAQRAQRSRIQMHRTKSTDHSHGGTLPASSAFKARPLNKKILEAPSLPPPQRSKPQLPVFQEFKLKTSERAIQHSLAAPSSLIESSLFTSSAQVLSEESKRLQNQDFSASQLQKNGSENSATKFKARVLDRKILSSKGDIGIFRSVKRETTMPKEFNFGASKRHHLQNPPTDLFSKLSLNSEVEQTRTSQAIFSQPIPPTKKGFKENIVEPGHQEVSYRSGDFYVENLRRLEQQHVRSENGVLGSFRIQSNSFRSLGIR